MVFNFLRITIIKFESKNNLGFLIVFKLISFSHLTDPSGGEFGAYMQVYIQNDGPVTLDIESPQFPPPKEVQVVVTGTLYSLPRSHRKSFQELVKVQIELKTSH